MTKSLFIGVRPGNVLSALRHHLVAELLDDRRIYDPSQSVLDVREQYAIAKYVKEHGPFEELVYGAAVNRLQWISDITSRDIDQAYDVNVRGLILLVAEHMRIYGKPPARIVAIVSDSSRTPMRGSLLYSSSKAALVGVLKNMARELAPDTAVVGVSPGIIDDTPMTDYIDNNVPVFRGWEPEAARNYEKTMIPMQRRAQKSEVVDTLMFALTGPAYLSGSIIEITGGK